jgi:hypothetical protein
MAVTVAGATAGLNQHAVLKAPMIQQKFRQGLEFESKLTPRACVNTYSAPNAVPTDLVQAYQWPFTAKGDVAFDAVENKLQKIKIDILITADDLEKFWDTYMVEWHEIGLDPMEWSFPRYLYENVYEPKILEEMNRNAWAGVYVAPTLNTAGTSVGSVNGFKKKIEDAITATSLTEYATGVWVDTTIVDQLETWCDSLPIPYRDAPGDIYMSNTLAKKYYRDHRDKFGTGNGVAGNENTELRVEMTQKRIVPINAMEGSNRIMFSPTTTRNMIWGTRAGSPTYFNIRWQQQDVRIIKGTAEIYRFYGFEFWDHLFVNDQA